MMTTKYPAIEFELINPESLQNGAIACYAIGVYEGTLKSGFDPLIDQRFYKDILMPLMATDNFSGKLGTSVTSHCFQQIGQVMLVGLGDKEKLNQEHIRQAASVLYKGCTQLKISKVAVHFPSTWHEQPLLKAFAEGILLTAHQDDRFKSAKNKDTATLQTVQLVSDNKNKDTTPIKAGKEVTAGVLLARELVNAPANYVTPSTLAKTALALSKKHHLELKILEKEDCEKLGMGAYLGVSQGSDMPPKFIHLCYKPKTIDKNSPFAKVALIGKGVTFDSGGLNLKIENSQIEYMKYDMAGAAAVLGAAEAIGALKPNKEVHFIIAATENMINGKAMHPGDIVTASNGKTIEVDNTDAEGRLTLADALVYAEKLKVDAIVDLATLTGSIVGALGERIAGLFSENKELVAALVATTHQTGEKIWQMPMEVDYFEGMKSIIADMRNTGADRAGGAITAALFLKQFVTKTPWAHIDLAGPVFTKKGYTYNNEGGTGYGVRLLVEWLTNNL